MNWVQARQHTSASSMLAFYRDNRSKLMPVPPKAKEVTQEKPRELVVLKNYDFHILAFRAQTNGKAYARYVAESGGYSLKALCVEYQRGDTFELRGSIAYDLVSRFGWSVSQVGKLMNKDPTSIANCISRHCSSHKLTAPQYRKTSKIDGVMDEIRVRYEAGEGIVALCEEYNVPCSTIRKAGEKAGWYIKGKSRNVNRSKIDIDAFKAAYYAGEKMEAIAEEFGHSLNVFKRIITREGMSRPSIKRTHGKAGASS